MELASTVYTEENTVLLLDSIGEDEEALFCRTDLTGCCTNPNLGQWLFPNGTQMHNPNSGDSIYRSRKDTGLALNRRHNVLSPLGTYCCELPTASSGGSDVTFCVSLSKLMRRTMRVLVYAQFTVNWLISLIPRLSQLMPTQEPGNKATSKYEQLVSPQAKSRFPSPRANCTVL